MQSKAVKVNSAKLQTLAIIALISASLGAIAKIMHWPFAEVLLGVGLIITLVLYVVFIRDLIKHRIHNKPFWAISLLILPFPTAFIYASRRDKLVLN